MPTPTAALLEVIAAYNNQTTVDNRIDTTDFTFDAPINNTNPGHLNNTLVIARPAAGSTHAGVRNIYYDRVDLSLTPVIPVIKKGSFSNVSQLISMINGYFEIEMTLTDYNDADITNAVGEYFISAHSNSYAFKGSLKVSLVAANPIGIS